MDPGFLEDLEYWTRTDRSLATRTLFLMEAILRDPFQGPGKPKVLRHGRLAGKSSRRIHGEHRLVYAVENERVYFLQARRHY